jgi:hypothetical protein
MRLLKAVGVVEEREEVRERMGVREYLGLLVTLV